MENIRDILNRLKIALKANSFNEVAKKLGVSVTTIDSWRNRKKIPEKYIVTLQLKGINPDWLLTGEGEMYKKETPKNINQGVIGIGGVGDNHNISVNNQNNPLQSLPADIQVVVEELLQMDKAKRKKVLKTILSMEE